MQSTDIAQMILHLLSHPEWNGVAGISAIISILLSMNSILRSRHSASSSPQLTSGILKKNLSLLPPRF